MRWPVWLLRLLGMAEPTVEPTAEPTVEPHPEMTTDAGERRHVEHEMEIASQHLGRQKFEEHVYPG